MLHQHIFPHASPTHASSCQMEENLNDFPMRFFNEENLADLPIA